MWLGISSGGQTAWVLVPLLVGLALGLLVPGSEFIEDRTLRVVSSILGWQYFLCWTVSFYPQVVLNYQRKSVQGLSIDLQYLNVLGFAAYSLFNSSLYWSHDIREEYLKRHGHPPSVHINDVAFAMNAFILCCVSLVQCYWYGGRPWRAVSNPTKIFCACSGVVILLCPLLLYSHVNIRGLTWISFVYVLSYIKLATTMVKYIPQIMLNQSRRSTTGFSCSQVILDLQGGLLSIAQQCMDAIIMGHSSFITGNIAKLGLGLASICFDGILMIQHWCVYPSYGEPCSLDTNSLL